MSNTDFKNTDKKLLCFFFFLIPLIHSACFKQAFTGPKVVAVALFVGYLFLGMGIKKFFKSPFRYLGGVLMFYTAGVLIVSGNSVFLGGDYLVLVPILIILGVLSGSQTENVKENLLYWNLVLLALLSLFAIGQEFGLPDFSSRFTDTLRPYTFLGNRNYTADLLILLVPFLIAAVEQISKKFILGFIPVLAAIVFTRSFRGILGLGSILLFYFLFTRPPAKKKYGVLAGVFLCLGVGFVFQNYSRITESNLRPRLLRWKITKNMIAENPVTGFGLGTFQYFYPQYQEEFFRESTNRVVHYKDIAQSPQRVNNEYLDVIIETGLIGFFMISGIFVLWYKKINLNYRKIDFPAAAGIFGLLASGFFGFPFHRPSILYIVAINMGVTVRPSGYSKTTIKGLKIYKCTLLILILFVVTVFTIYQIKWEKADREFVALDYTQALKQSKNALTYSFIPGKIYFLKGRIYYRKNMFLNALENYNKAEKTFAHRSLYFNRGLVHYKMFQYDDAEKDFEKAWYTTPEFQPAFNMLEQLYINLNKKEKLKNLRAMIKDKEFSDPEMNFMKND